jgi:pimeloyl-ACP methyl ester carboxylesterase
VRKMAHFNLDGVTQRALSERLKGIKMTNWSVDDHINHDIPAAIRYVLKKTGQKRVHWIGHSMGGMAMFAYLGQNPNAQTQIKSFVAAAVPMVAFHPLSEPMQLLVDAEAAIGVGSKLVGSSAPATWGAIFGDLQTPTDKLFFHGDNVEPDVVRALNKQAQEEIAPSQLKQLIAMLRTERFTSLDGSIDYVEALTRVEKPTCFLVGTVDNMATPGAVRFAYRQIASDDKEFNLFGRVNSHKDDYGHDDVIIGRNARSEVYPVIRKWLDRHPRHPDDGTLMLQPAAPAQDQN